VARKEVGGHVRNSDERRKNVILHPKQGVAWGQTSLPKRRGQKKFRVHGAKNARENRRAAVGAQIQRSRRPRQLNISRRPSVL